jgi:hypothetical protein
MIHHLRFVGAQNTLNLITLFWKKIVLKHSQIRRIDNQKSFLNCNISIRLIAIKLINKFESYRLGVVIIKITVKHGYNIQLRTDQFCSCFKSSLIVLKLEELMFLTLDDCYSFLAFLLFLKNFTVLW